MARLSDADLEKIKRDVPLDALVRAKGITLKKHGADLVGLCPFHDDKTPSLVISPAKNLWHCLGACQAGGSVIDWVMKAEGISFRHAVTLLQKDFSTLVASVVSSAAEPVKKSTVRKVSLLMADADQQTLAQQVIDYYHQTLKQSPVALDYLRYRGIYNEELIDTFKLGYGDRTLGYHLPLRNRKDGSSLRGRLQQLGFWRSSGHEHFNGSLVVPIFDAQGHVVEAYGRRASRKVGEQYSTVHLYLPGPHAGIWNAQVLREHKEMIVCEALIDAMTFWCAGYRNVTASYGVEGFTADHLAAFKQHRIERVLIAYDADEAGNKAADKLAEQLTHEGIDCYRLRFPKGMDANSYARSVAPAEQSLGHIIRAAEWIGNGKAVCRVVTAAVINGEAAPAPVSAPLLAAQSVNEIELPNVVTPPATPMASPAPVDIATEVNANEIVFTLGERRYRVRGLAKNLGVDQLKVNLLVSYRDAFHVDSLDLYAARARATYIAQAARELTLNEDVMQRDMGKLLLQLEVLQEQQLKKASEPAAKAAAVVAPDDARAALDLLRDPNLLQRILNDFATCGVVGEETNKLVGYLAAVSRQLDEPLAVMIQSSSAAGKSALMDAVLALVPEEARIKYSAMTGQSLYYLGETNLKNKILAIAEEEGASQAAYALKLLQSEGELTIASTGKDPVTGELVTKDYHVEGPVMLFLTTTAIDIDPELMNRCLVLGVNEDREQTRAIHAQQRYSQTLEGQLAKKAKPTLLQLHRNAQRLLKPLMVVNPYAHQLTFLDDKTRTRRDHKKYLTLIRAVTLLHQYQREMKTRQHGGEQVHYIEATLADIETANRLAHEVLGRTLDELPPQTRNLLRKLYDWVIQACAAQSIKQNDFRFSRKDVRAFTGWGDTQLKIHLARLVELEHVLVHRTARGFVYELLYDGHGQDGKPFVNGLLDVNTLPGCSYDAERSGDNEDRAGIGRVLVGGESGHGRDGGMVSEAKYDGLNGHRACNGVANAHLETSNIIASNVHPLLAAASLEATA